MRRRRDRRGRRHAGRGLQGCRIDAELCRGFGDALLHQRQPFGIGRRIGGEIDPALQCAFRVALLRFRERQVIARTRRALLVAERRLESLARRRRHRAVGGDHLCLAPIAHDVGAMAGQIGGVAVSVHRLGIMSEAQLGTAEQQPSPQIFGMLFQMRGDLPDRLPEIDVLDAGGGFCRRAARGKGLVGQCRHAEPGIKQPRRERHRQHGNSSDHQPPSRAVVASRSLPRNTLQIPSPACGGGLRWGHGGAWRAGLQRQNAAADLGPRRLGLLRHQQPACGIAVDFGELVTIDREVVALARSCGMPAQQ